MFNSKFIDHTNLKPQATKEDILKLCNEAYINGFKSVCVNPCYVELASSLLHGSDCIVCTVIGFPLGANTTSVKVFETVDAITNGASEIDMVINIGMALNHDYDGVYEDIKAVVDAALGLPVKVIIETCYLNEEEIVEVCKCAKRANALFVKTSTGFGTSGATESDVKLMKETVGDTMEVKASGGIKTYEDYVKMVNAGATRIGTSNGIKIMEGEKNE